MRNGIKYYLAAYNLTALLLWAGFVVFYMAGSGQLTAQNMLLLNIAQGMAALEILHAVMRWVKSPVLSTAAQVASRLLVLLLINLYFTGYRPPLPLGADSFLQVGITLAVMAWGITEIIRYSLYFLGLTGRQPAWLLWMRYSFFIVLYPLGVFGEWLIFIFVLIPAGPALNIQTATIAVLLVSYVFYFPQLYGYMWKQRKAKLA